MEHSILRQLLSIIVLISSLLFNCFSQLQLVPVAGLAVTKSRVIEGNETFTDANHNSDLWGFEIIKKYNDKLNIIFPFHISEQLMSVAETNTFVYSLNAVKYQNHVILNKIFKPKHVPWGWFGSQLLSIGVIVEYTVLDLHFINRNLQRAYKKDIVNPKKINIEFKPSFGITLNEIPRGCYSGCSSSNFDYGGDGSYSGFLYVHNGWDSYIVKNYNTLSLNYGFKIQFKNKYDKDRLFFKVMLSQGLMTIMESPFQANVGDNQNVILRTAILQSKGTYWGIYASYPITILNKKGERYRDRHPKG